MDSDNENELIDLSLDSDMECVEEKKEKPASFRFNAQKAFLTFAQANRLTKSKILDMAKAKGSLQRYVIGEEDHLDGGKHFHCFLHWGKKLDSRRVDYFDVKVLTYNYHPNIKGVKRGTDLEVIEYCMKDQDYEDSGGLVTSVFPNSKGFTKKITDHCNWHKYMRQMKLRNIDYPVLLPDDVQVITKPDPITKQRHWLISAPPSYGKTRWVNCAFGGKRVYCVPTDTEYPFEDYKDEDIIIFDDYMVNAQNTCKVEAWVIAATNTWFVLNQVPGKVRYVTKYWRLGHTRTIIWLCNECPTFFLEERMQHRFRTLVLEQEWKPLDAREPYYEEEKL